MKGFLLAAAVSVATLVAISYSLRQRLPFPLAWAFIAIYGIAVAVLVMLYLLTPPDLGFLPPRLQGSPRSLDLALSLFALSASYFGGWLQLFNLAERGYSLRLLIDLLERRYQPLSPEELTKLYAGGLGLHWMYRRRLDGLLGLGCVTEQSGVVKTTRRGRRIARLFRWLRQLYRVGDVK